MASQQIGSLFVKISSNAAAMANQATKAFSSSVGNIAQSFNKASAGLSIGDFTPWYFSLNSHQ